MTPQIAHSSISLPSLRKLSSLAPGERENALAGWVSWLNVNRHRVSISFERDLDQALLDLQDERVSDNVLQDLDERFARWLESAGIPGEGRGPNETLEDI